MISKIIKISSLVAVFVSSTFAVAAGDGCNITIDSPKHKSIVVDNKELSEQNLFAFTVSGAVTNLGNNKLCLYLSKPGGEHWWRSGNAITKDKLGPDNDWTITSATCGNADNPHIKCLFKAVVQQTCPGSGETVTSIPNIIAETATYIVETKK